MQNLEEADEHAHKAGDELKKTKKNLDKKNKKMACCAFLICLVVTVIVIAFCGGFSSSSSTTVEVYKAPTASAPKATSTIEIPETTKALRLYNKV